MILAKLWAAGRNDYQIVIVAYKKRNVLYTVGTEALTVSSVDPADTGTTLNYLHEDATEFTITGGLVGDRDKIVGSPAIDYTSVGSGRYATIIAVSEDTVYLDRPIGENANGVMVIVERDGTTIQDGSPVTQVMMTRTALRE